MAYSFSFVFFLLSLWDYNVYVHTVYKKMEGLQKGWFSEVSAFSPGQAMSIEVDGTPLHHEKSEFQDILFIKTKHWGNMLVLDGAIQCTERDEFAYQEMITHLPLYAHPNPKKVCHSTILKQYNIHTLTSTVIP